jgi:hypothetical protein
MLTARRWLRRAPALGEELGRGLLFFACLGWHLRRPVTLEQARATLRERLEHRERDFLDLVGRTIYARRGSPYRRLLRQAGCEAGDLERLVGREGVEGALHALYRQGVYLTADELKGKRPVERGSLRFAVRLEQLRNPCWLVPAPIQSRGRLRPGGLVPIYRAMLADLAVNASLGLAARGGTGWVYALWGKPDPVWAVWLIRHAGCGYRPVRWFSLIDPRAEGLGRYDRWVARLVPWISRQVGASLPGPEYVPFEEPLPIIKWMRQELRGGRTPHLIATVSWAVHLCQVAYRSGHELGGAQCSIGGEPFTAARLQAVRQVGAAAVPTYGTKESGPLAHGCLAPSLPDDLHLYDDLNAVIQPGPSGAVAGLPPDALLISSLRRSWPFVLLNVSLGDRADLAERACDCPLERLGWTTHVHTVRSFEKLKVAGMVLLDTEVMRLLEEVLPARFGGGPTDYQLVDDEEIIDGAPRLRLLVHPEVGAVDERAVAEAFLAFLREAGVPVDRLWREVRWLGVERRPPLVTAGGKIYQVHRASGVPGLSDHPR